MKKLREYNMYWKVRLERLLIDEGFVIPDEGLPFKSLEWRDVYLDIINRLDDMDLMFDGDHFLAELALYIHAGNDENKPRLLSLAINRGHDDVVKRILEDYTGDVGGFCFYTVLGQYKTQCYDPIKDSIYISSPQTVQLLIDADRYEEYLNLVYIAMSMGRDDVATILLNNMVADESIVAVIQSARKGIILESYTDYEYILALTTAMFYDKVDLISKLVHIDCNVMLNDTDAMKRLVKYTSNKEVFRLTLIRYPNYMLESLMISSVDNNRLDILSVFIKYEGAKVVIPSVVEYCVKQGKKEAAKMLYQTNL
jgi:hypothetical protein